MSQTLPTRFAQALAEVRPTLDADPSTLAIFLSDSFLRGNHQSAPPAAIFDLASISDRKSLRRQNHRDGQCKQLYQDYDSVSVLVTVP